MLTAGVVWYCTRAGPMRFLRQLLVIAAHVGLILLESLVNDWVAAI